MREPFALKLLERFERFKECAFVGRGVTQQEGEKFLVERWGIKGLVLAAANAIEAPVGLGHFFDQQSFGRGGRLVFLEQGVAELLKLGGVFAGEETLSDVTP